MYNYLFLVLIFLFISIEIICSYKFFRLKRKGLGVVTALYSLFTLILTLSYFSSRNILTENELQSLINGLSDFNLFAILILILNILMIIISIISYIKVMKWSREIRNAKE